jgi:hypothetical protein
VCEREREREREIEREREREIHGNKPRIHVYENSAKTRKAV